MSVEVNLIGTTKRYLNSYSGVVCISAVIPKVIQGLSAAVRRLPGKRVLNTAEAPTSGTVFTTWFLGWQTAVSDRDESGYKRGYRWKSSSGPAVVEESVQGT